MPKIPLKISLMFVSEDYLLRGFFDSMLYMPDEKLKYFPHYFQVYFSGSVLDDDVYLQPNKSSRIMKGYRSLIHDMAEILSIDNTTIDEDINEIIEFETELANVSKSSSCFIQFRLQSVYYRLHECISLYSYSISDIRLSNCKFRSEYVLQQNDDWTTDKCYQ